MRQLRPEFAWHKEGDVKSNETIVAITHDDLLVLSGAINETFEAIADWEFQTRVGATPEQVRNLQSRLNELLRATGQSD